MLSMLTANYNSFKAVNFQRTELILLQNKLKEHCAMKPNSTNYNIYVETLQVNCKLTPFQFYCTLGLLLSDASRSLNVAKTGGRIKLQQTVRHWDFVNHLVNEIYPEWCFLVEPRPVSATREHMVSFQTLTLPVFRESFDFLYDLNNKKIVTGEIERYLHPIALAYWFCGDGGKSDYHGNSKAIALHTQGFDLESIQHLVEGLSMRYGWDVVPVKQRGRNQWWIRIRNFDDFITKVGPYIHPSMLYKLPTARSDKSLHGHMPASLYNDTCGSFFHKCPYKLDVYKLNARLK